MVLGERARFSTATSRKHGQNARGRRVADPATIRLGISHMCASGHLGAIPIGLPLGAASPGRSLAKQLGTELGPFINSGCSIGYQSIPLVSDVPKTKLTHQQAYEIRTRRAARERVKDLALEYGVTPGAITRICSGENHRQVSGPRTANPRPRTDAGRRVRRSDVEAGVTSEIEP